MNNNAFLISLAVAATAAVFLSASPCRAEEAAEGHEHSEHQHHGMTVIHEHAKHKKAATATTPAQKKAQALLKKGNALYQEGAFEDALRVYTDAISADPTLFEAFYKRGLAFFKLGSDLNALEDLSKAIVLDPENADAYFQRGVVWHYKGDDEKMIEDFKTAADLSMVDHTKHEHMLK